MQSNNNVMLTIIMPVFNHCRDVATMIDSILANDYDDWELLAVDDGSDSETLELLGNYAAADHRIRFVRRDVQPKGAQTCRNMGLERAQGKYCVVFDSDDYIAPYCLRQRVEAMQRHTGLDFMVFPSGVFVDGKFSTEAHPYDFGYRLGGSDIEKFASRRLPFIVWNNIYRTESLRRRHMKWDERLLSLQDADFNISAIAAGMKYTYADARPDYGYRIVNASSISKKINSAQHVKSHCLANEKMYATVQGIAGHRYDAALYDGMMNIYNANMSGTGINDTLASGLADTLARRSKRYARLLRLQICATHVLQHVLPARRARQIAVAAYLLRTQHWRKAKVRLIAQLKVQRKA